MSKRVLIVSKFYYPRGGDCVCAINLEAMLKHAGHATSMFAVRHDKNLTTHSQENFATEVDFNGGIGNKARYFARMLGHGDIRKTFAKVLADFKPDVVHFHNIHSYLSPEIVKMAHEYGARTVWTLHDYKLICPTYSCRREGNNSCEDCFTTASSSKFNVVKHRCHKGSLAGSIAVYIEALRWNRKLLAKYTDAFICPSEFMRSKMLQGGFPAHKLHVISNCIDEAKKAAIDTGTITQREDYYIYVGRLSAEKGAGTLLEAASKLPYKLKVLGDGPEMAQLKDKYAHCNNIEFLGQCDAPTVSSHVAKAQCTVIPSECYENNPLSAIESLYAGTPIVGAQIGGIPELITAENGIRFLSGDVESLKSAIKEAHNRRWDYAKIKADAAQKFAPSEYLNHTVALYQ